MATNLLKHLWQHRSGDCSLRGIGLLLFRVTSTHDDTSMIYSSMVREVQQQRRLSNYSLWHMHNTAIPFLYDMPNKFSVPTFANAILQINRKKNRTIQKASNIPIPKINSSWWWIVRKSSFLISRIILNIRYPLGKAKYIQKMWDMYVHDSHLCNQIVDFWKILGCLFYSCAEEERSCRCIQTAREVGTID